MSAVHVLNLLPEATSLLGGAPSARSTLVRHAREIFVASSAALLVPASPAVRPGHLRLPLRWGCVGAGGGCLLAALKTSPILSNSSGTVGQVPIEFPVCVQEETRCKSTEYVT